MNSDFEGSSLLDMPNDVYLLVQYRVLQNHDMNVAPNYALIEAILLRLRRAVKCLREQYPGD